MADPGGFELIHALPSRLRTASPSFASIKVVLPEAVSPTIRALLLCRGAASTKRGDGGIYASILLRDFPCNLVLHA